MDTAIKALDKYFGYSTFRPLQKEIITDVVNRKDVFVLIPTGGGKSLCYELPSLLMDGTTIVISPLISLMKDQVDSLRQNGIAAAYLNSSLSTEEQQELLEKVKNKKIKLLYVAPERLVLPRFISLLKTLPINFFAIDEAHCISQWGNDFRPEYRQLALLKKEFLDVPVIALTATATTRVRDDIVTQLTLRKPAIYQASFNRQNLTYHVLPKQGTFDKVLGYIKDHPGEAGIVYCQSRKRVEDVVSRLQNEGIKALAYHAGLPDEDRKANQEAFLWEDVNVIVATVAFGMGINKPNVRFVIHYDLPKTIEHYYQETGRAGRDGLPSECLLFFSSGDARFYDRFILEIPDEKARLIARQQLQKMVEYGQSSLCRRKQLLAYFAEDFDQENCKGCDNCLSPKETIDATVVTQKILSCIYRTAERFGVNHIGHVLTGSKRENVLRNNHDKLSVYGIETEYGRSELKQFIAELVQLGYLHQTDDQFGVLSLTNKGKQFLKNKESIRLAKPIMSLKTTKKQAIGNIDPMLFNRLRALRKRLADQAGVPPYVIFSDKSLQDMVGKLPKTEFEFAGIYGVGQEKLKRFAKTFLEEIASYLENVPKISDNPRETTQDRKHITPNQVYQLYKSGKTIEEIAKESGYVVGTISGKLQEIYLHGGHIVVDEFVYPEKQKIIAQAFAKLGIERLRPIKDLLGDEYSYDELRWIQTKLRKEQNENFGH